VFVLITAGGMHEQFELRLRDAVSLLAGLDRPADLICCDPPYALGWDTSGSPDAKRHYARDQAKLIRGYADVDPASYAEWTAEWVQAASGALRPGAQLAVVTGPQQAARVQVTAEQAGLVWVASIAAFRDFALRTLSRPACSHWTVTVMCRGPLDHPGRVFNAAPDLPRSARGGQYPLDWWPDNGRADRPGLMRYPASLPLRLVLRIVTSFSSEGDHVVDPFLGGGSTAVAAWLLRRCFTGGDVNREALRFSAARLMEEHIRPAELQPGLFDRPRG
jgi:DNA modification methylase